MYSLAPIVNTNEPIDLPTCMYKLHRIQGFGETISELNIDSIEKRQYQLLERLGNFKNNLNEIKNELGLTPTVTDAQDSKSKTETIVDTPGKSCLKACVDNSSTKENLLNQIETLKNSLNQLKKIINTNSSVIKTSNEPRITSCVSLVLHANPCQPPIGLSKMIEDLVSSKKILIKTSVHSHSSLKQSLNSNTLNLFAETNCKDSIKAQLKLTIIWKNANDTVAIFGNKKIRGEVNIGRYLARIFDFGYQDNKNVESTLIDEILDQCYAEVVWGDNSTAQKFVTHLDKLLANSNSSILNNSKLLKYLIGSALSNNGVKVNSNHVNKWIQSILGQNKTTSSSLSKQTDLFNYLSTNGIQYDNTEHPEVFTVDTMMPYLTHIQGAITKNLFLKDRSKNLYLLSALHDRKIDLKAIGKKINSKDLRFGDENIMLEKLGVKQGCVTPFALMNDKNNEVKFLADKSLLDGSFDRVYGHPLVNTATTGITQKDFLKFIQLTGHKFTEVVF